MDATKPCKFIGFGAMDVTKPYKSIGFGAMDVTKSYKLIRFGAMRLGNAFCVCSRSPTIRSKPNGNNCD